MKTRFLIFGMMFFLLSCGSNDQNTKNENNDKSDNSVKSKDMTGNTPQLNNDSLVKVIDIERDRIENNLKSLQRKTLQTSNLREQIKQKWSKIDFYTENGHIVRIKTYPYGKISTRTEEFYFRNNQLMLTFIEDQGSMFTGKSGTRSGKTYYFLGDAYIKEVNLTNEKETTIRSSDSERLLQEANEYLKLYSGK